VIVIATEIPQELLTHRSMNVLVEMGMAFQVE
jgi:hypothetical protein